ncbi:hypothetical protein GCM10019016_110630 [Streptomyces prasinosporus]|uniref:GH15-like domain-containing protein n=1 Tax=Streptomyces prasinosporus TaxID=68256 RepID=A0ABP6U8F1_9ACTN
MYGIAGERELGEAELDWLPGYETPAPVRVGNGAASQLQLDVYGEVTEALHLGPHDWPGPQRLRVPAPAEADPLPGEALAGAGRGHLGGARSRAATSCTPR